MVPPDDLVDWYPDENISEVRNCLCEENGFWGMQIDAPATWTHHTKITKQRGAWANFANNWRNFVEHCTFEQCGDAGIWCNQSDESETFGELYFRNNDISGSLNKAGVYFRETNKNPKGRIEISHNKLPASKDVVDAPETVKRHDGYREFDNGWDAEGAS